MSNMIKAYTVRYDEEARKKIDNHLKKETEILVQRNLRLAQTEDENGFVEGIQALVVDVADPEPSEEEAKENASQILEDAKKEAKNILEKAKQEAEKLKADTMTSAKKKGYEEGIQQGLKEVQKRLSECDAKEKKQQEEYETLISELEPGMAEIMSELIEKITGIIVEDKQEVILYLVQKAFKNFDKTDEFTIRTGKEDYEYLLAKKDYLITTIGREVQLNITEDPSLKKNQCMIETDLKVIDCSLDVQLSNLIDSIKLMSRI